MTVWIFPSNNKTFDSEAAFRAMPEVSWSETGAHHEVGDTVYLYTSSPVSAITHQCVVTAARQSEEQIIDDEPFWVDKDAMLERLQRRSWMRLRAVTIFDDAQRAALALPALRENGLRGTVAGRLRAVLELIAYIEEVTQQGAAGDDLAAESAEFDTGEVEQFRKAVVQHDYRVDDRTSTSKTRGSAQRAFAEVVKANYGYRCAITGVSTRAFLVASHIVPWSEDASIRLDPSNGICLSTLVDRAFDTGFLRLGEDYTVHVDRDLVAQDEALARLLMPYDGSTLTEPSQQGPNPAHLRRRLGEPQA